MGSIVYKSRPFKGGPKNGRKMNLMLSTHKFDAKANKPVKTYAYINLILVSMAVPILPNLW